MSELEMSKDFQTKMFEKIRSQMGDLINEEEMKSLLKTAIDKAFFEERRIPANSAFGRDEIKESHFVTMVREEIKTTLHEELQEWLKENKEAVHEIIKDTIGQGFFQIIKNHIQNKISQDMFLFEQNIMNKFGN